MTRGTVVLVGVGVLVFVVVVLVGRTALPPDTGHQQTPMSDPRADCIAYANATVTKNPQAVWVDVFDGCAANHPTANGDRLNLGPKAVRTESIPAPIGGRSTGAGR